MPSFTSCVNLLRTAFGSSKSANSPGSWSTAPHTDSGWRISAASAKIPALLVPKIAAGARPRPASSAAASSACSSGEVAFQPAGLGLCPLPRRSYVTTVKLVPAKNSANRSKNAPVPARAHHQQKRRPIAPHLVVELCVIRPLERHESRPHDCVCAERAYPFSAATCSRRTRSERAPARLRALSLPPHRTSRRVGRPQCSYPMRHDTPSPCPARISALLVSHEAVA